MRKRKSSITKINPPSIIISPVNNNLPPFHIQFPFKLSYNDRGEDKVCYFSCKEHLQTHIQRYKLKRGDVKLEKTPPKQA